MSVSSRTTFGLLVAAFAGTSSLAAQMVPLAVRPRQATATESFLSVSELRSLTPAGHASITFPREAGSLEPLVGNIERAAFEDRIIAMVASTSENEDARVLLKKRADVIRATLATGRRTFRTRLALTGPSEDDTAIVRAMAVADAQATRYDSLAYGIPPAAIERRVRPVALTSEPQARCYWGRRGQKTLASTALAFGEDRGTVGVDLYEDYFGGVRFTFGSAVSAAHSQDSTEANMQRFIAAGGNAYLAGSFPIAAFSMNRIECDPDATPPQHRPDVSFLMEFSPRIAADLPALGTTIDQATGNLDLGFDMRLTAAGSDRRIAVAARFRPAYVIGNSRFYDGIGYADQKAFFYGMLTAGIVLEGKYSFAASFPVFAPSSLQDAMRGVFSVGLRP